MTKLQSPAKRYLSSLHGGNYDGIALSPRAQSWLVMSFIAITLLALAWYVVPYLFNTKPYPTNVSTSVANSTTEGFQADGNAVKKAKDALAALPETEQRQVCAPTVSLVTGYRSLFSGATFKFQESKADSGEFFLYGPDMRVVEVAADGSGSLTLAIRNEHPGRQLFVRELATKHMDGSDIASDGKPCYVFSAKSDPDMALQYEHQHLSLRPLNRAPVSSPNNRGDARPFIGQCFIRFQASEADFKTTALATQLGIPRLSGHHLGSGVGTNGSGISAESEENGLVNMTQEIEQQARTPAVRDYAAYQSAGGSVNANPFANKPIRVNLNLGAAMAQDSFSTDADGSASRNPDSGGATSVRALLDKYTAKQLGSQNSSTTPMVSDKELAINKAYLAAAAAGSGSGMNGTLGTAPGAPVGCPVIDRSKYYTERQLAQCAGCTPDDFLRGN